MGGDTLVHTDVRDDNILVRPDGTAVLCDWNFPCVGADWIDTLMLLVGPRGDGLDVEAVLSSRRLTRDVPAESIDIVLALVTGYFLRQARRARSRRPRPTSATTSGGRARCAGTGSPERRGWL